MSKKYKFAAIFAVLFILPLITIADDSSITAPTKALPASTASTNSQPISDIQALPIYLGSRGSEVSRYQKKLVDLEYLRVNPTGWYGPITTAAVNSFQKDNGLPVNGTIDERTAFAINQIHARAVITEEIQTKNVYFASTITTLTKVTLTLVTSNKEIAVGKPFTLAWKSTNATSCYARNSWSGSLDLTGTKTLTSNTTGTKQYTVRCSNSKTGSRSQKSVYVSVVNSVGDPLPPEPAPTAAPTLKLVANPTSVASGGKTILSWTNTNTSTCTGTGLGFSGTQPVNAQETISNLTSTQTFSLTCTGAGGSVTTSVVVTVSSPTPTPTPTPTATCFDGIKNQDETGIDTGGVCGTTTQGYTQLPSIATNFDINSELVPSWGTGAIPTSALPDVVGAFRFICNPSHLSYDDPIVYPGQPGKAHLHQFFGNTLANANSTYDSLRKTGMSTCNSPLNRSAYWIPAMLDGKGGVVKPDYFQIYYKGRPKTDPKCATLGKACIDLPRGLKYIFGAGMINGTQQTSTGYFNCIGAGAIPGHYSSIVEAAKNCPVGAQLGAVIASPPCWNGVDLDSPDHRSHMAYPANPNDVNSACPATHPYLIPQFTLGAWYTTDANLDRSGTWSTASPSTWHFSSDAMPGMPMMKPGTSFHADWFGAWDDTVLNMWSTNCVGKLLNCSGGDLGNGKQLKMFTNFTWLANPRVIPVPSNP